MKSKYEVRVKCNGMLDPFIMYYIWEDGKEALVDRIKMCYSTGFNIKEENIEVIIKEIPLKKYRFTYKYKECVINLILYGTDELDAFKEFDKYAKRFKLPMNYKMNVKVKELRNNNE